ncbi:MAG TPA: hypothetical protein VF989_16550 [Polyangiaceae bacterium]
MPPPTTSRAWAVTTVRNPCWVHFVRGVVGAVAFAAGLSACGAGMPGLHPAEPLGSRQVSASAGFSHHFVPGTARRAIEDADRVVAEEMAPLAEEQSETLARGALTEAIATPALSPWFAARAGMGQGFEAGLGYTGRRVRADLRRAFERDTYALSIGGALTGVVPDPGSVGDSPPSALPDGSERLGHADLGNVRGFGVDVPLLVGLRTDPSFGHAWLGVRPGYERTTGDAVLVFAGTTPVAADFEGRTLSLTTLLGASLGVGPISVAAELAVGWYALSGSLTLGGSRSEADVSGVAFTPAAAVTGKLD